MLKALFLILMLSSFFSSSQNIPDFAEIEKETKAMYKLYSDKIEAKVGKLKDLDPKDTVKIMELTKKRIELNRSMLPEINAEKTKIINKLTNTTFPDFYFEDFNGKIYSLSDFNNKKVVLNFNYTFCDRCVKQIDSLIQKTGDKARIIVLMHDKKTDADHIYEAYGDKILLGFISLEYEHYYTLNSSTPTTFLLEEKRLIKYFDDPMLEDSAAGGLFSQLKLF